MAADREKKADGKFVKRTVQAQLIRTWRSVLKATVFISKLRYNLKLVSFLSVGLRNLHHKNPEKKSGAK